jgi:hypothetical protein
MKIGLSVADTGISEHKAHNFVFDESTQHLAADLGGDNIHLRWNDVALAESPDRELEFDHLFELRHSVAVAYLYRFSGHVNG